MTRLQSHVWRQPPFIQALLVLAVLLAVSKLFNAAVDAAFGWTSAFSGFDLFVPAGFAVYAYVRAVQRNRTAQ